MFRGAWRHVPRGFPLRRSFASPYRSARLFRQRNNRNGPRGIAFATLTPSSRYRKLVLDLAKSINDIHRETHVPRSRCTPAAFQNLRECIIARVINISSNVTVNPALSRSPMRRFVMIIERSCTAMLDASLDRVADWFINRHPEPRVLLGELTRARAHYITVRAIPEAIIADRNRIDSGTSARSAQSRRSFVKRPFPTRFFPPARSNSRAIGLSKASRSRGNLPRGEEEAGEIKRGN